MYKTKCVLTDPVQHQINPTENIYFGDIYTGKYLFISLRRNIPKSKQNYKLPVNKSLDTANEVSQYLFTIVSTIICSIVTYNCFVNVGDDTFGPDHEPYHEMVLHWVQPR